MDILLEQERVRERKSEREREERKREIERDINIYIYMYIKRDSSRNQISDTVSQSGMWCRTTGTSWENSEGT